MESALSETEFLGTEDEVDGFESVVDGFDRGPLDVYEDASPLFRDLALRTPNKLGDLLLRRIFHPWQPIIVFDFGRGSIQRRKAV